MAAPNRYEHESDVGLDHWGQSAPLNSGGHCTPSRQVKNEQTRCIQRKQTASPDLMMPAAATSR